ncbi:cell division protein FtsZ, partial [Streptomyces pharetrae CZA14]
VTVIAAGFDGGQPPARRDNVLGSASSSSSAPARREEPAPARQPESRPSFGSLGSVTPKEEPEPAPEPVNDIPVAPPVTPAPRTYTDSAAEELDVPDFLK